ncbi:DNA repair protein REV1 isoform X1 [Electrophorus electricus]|uniref:DNA repair protein REV1 isoform X1 n=2 Tax=Electrophorus electricus TaxID=8005 RepID=UPI0015D02F8F|nr:DNA repair protein REV1 isoform X1 [Electrophorus electricus]XP_035378850.1 DNA repair protein REV1 isoform X1 [Electrophorus electricus]
MSGDGWRKKASEDDGWGGRGGYMAAKVSKLEQQFQKEAPREREKHGTFSSIFHGVAIYVNGYTEPSADELRRLMMLHGGQFHLYYSRSMTTHVIATNLPNCKIQELKDEKVVRPEWITDSIKAGRQLSYLEYQLYTKQKSLNFTATRTARGPVVATRHPEVAPPPLASTQPLSHPAVFISRGSSSIHTEKGHGTQNARVRNGCCVGSSEHEGHSINGVREGDAGDDSPILTPRGSKDFLQTNGHARPPNGALTPPDRVPCSERGLRRVESRCPQSEAGETEVSCSPPARPARVPEPPSPRAVTLHEENPSLPLKTPSANTTAKPEGVASAEEPLAPISRLRLNGSHRSTCSSTVKESGKPAGRMSAQGPEAGAISEFFSRSRLHHIATWRNEFSEYVSTLQSHQRAAGGGVFSGKERLKKMRANHCAGPSSLCPPHTRKPCILHVDMDCFFVSVGIRHRPELKGKPVAVTSSRGRGLVAQRPGTDPQLEFQYYQMKQNQHRAARGGEDLETSLSPETEEDNWLPQDQVTVSMAEIASCSYEARQAGVRNGMFFGRAKQLCPELQPVPYDFHAYKEVAFSMYQTLASYTYRIEALSCDEALLDATALLEELGVSPDDLASAIRAEVKERTGCPASVGMGSNVLLAKMATRKAKPNGQYFLRPEEVDDFIRDQPVTSLPGVGRSMSSKLASLGVSTCGDLQQVAMLRLQKEFGPRTGQMLFRFCRGLDERPVRSEKDRKSVSAEMNYNIRFAEVEEAETFLTNLSLEVEKRLQGAGLRGRRVTLKVMMRKPGAPVEPAKYGGHGICDSLARSVLLAQPTDSGQLIAAEVVKLFRTMTLAVADMRGVGLQVQLLESASAREPGSRSIRDLLAARRPTHGKEHRREDELPRVSSHREGISSSATPLSSFSNSKPGTSKGPPPPPSRSPGHAPSHSSTRLNFSIEVPSPSQVDRSVLDALPAELREQVKLSWGHREEKPSTSRHLPLPTFSSTPPVASSGLLHLPEQPGQTASTGIVLELPDFSQVDPEVFAALPRELQEELRSAYRCRETAQAQRATAEQRNPLLLLRQPASGRTYRRHKRRNASPTKKGASPLKRNSPAKPSSSKPNPLPLKGTDMPPGFKIESGPTSSSSLNHRAAEAEALAKFTPRPVPALAGACELGDIRALLHEWVTTISEPMEEDILQVVKYCTELVEEKDLEKLDLVIKYMKRLMQRSVESVWSMAFDFILDNIQVVVHQAYGSTLKIT